MDNNFNKDTQNNINSKTYTGMPERLMNSNAVSQNRTIPPVKPTEENNSQPTTPSVENKNMGMNNSQPMNPTMQNRNMGMNNGQPMNPNMQNRNMGMNNGQPMNPNMQNRNIGMNNGQPMNPNMQNRNMGMNNGQPMNPNTQNRNIGMNNGQPMNPNMQNRNMGMNHGQPMNPNMQNRNMGMNNGQPMSPTMQNRNMGMNNGQPMNSDTENKKADINKDRALNLDKQKNPVDIKSDKHADIVDLTPDTKLEITSTNYLNTKIKSDVVDDIVADMVDDIKITDESTPESLTTKLPHFMDDYTQTDNQPKPKQDVKYNYQALTPPDNKKTGIIVFVYILTVILLIAGLIGISINLGDSTNFKDKFDQFISDIKSDFSESFGDDTQYPDFGDDDTNDFDDYNMDILTPYSLTIASSDQTVEISAPEGIELDTKNSSASEAFYTDYVIGAICAAQLIPISDTDNEEEQINLILNPYNDDLLSYEELDTEYGDSFFLLNFSDRTEVATFLSVDDNVVLAIRAYTNDIDDAIDTDALARAVSILSDNAGIVNY